MQDDLEFKVELKERLVKIEIMLENMNKTNEMQLMTMESKMKSEIQTQEEKIKVANNRIKDLEENLKWLWRAVAVPIIGLVVAFLFKSI